MCFVALPSVLITETFANTVRFSLQASVLEFKIFAFCEYRSFFPSSSVSLFIKILVNTPKMVCYGSIDSLKLIRGPVNYELERITILSKSLGYLFN